MLDLPAATGRIARSALVVLVLGASIALGVRAAEAGRYVLEEGARYQLCREYAATLAEAGSFAPDTWEWPVSPRFPDFRKPQWEALDPHANRELILRLIHDRLAAKPFSPERRQTDGELQRQRLNEGLSTGEARLERTRADIDHNATPEMLYRIRFSRGRAWGYYVDKEKDADLASRYHWDVISVGVDAMLYRGRLYLLANHVPYLKVFELHRAGPMSELALIPVCEFNYSE